MSFGDIRASDLLDTLQIGVVVHSCDTKICYANPKALELLRLSTNQVLERTGLDPNWGFLDRHGNQMPIEDYPVNRVVRSKSALKGLQVGISDSSKHVTWLNCHAYPEFDADGEVDRVVVNFIDITSQKEAIPFKEIVTLSSDAILVTESTTIDKPEPKIIFANQAFYDLTGYSELEVLGNNPRMMQGKKTNPATRQRINEAIAQKVPTRVTILNYRKDGTPYWNELSLFPLKNEYDEVIYFVGVQRDVSERKKREEEINAANQKLHHQNLALKEINEQKNKILGIVAHDLRNPLYALTTSFQLVGEFVDRNDPELFEIIDSSINNMNAIIEDLIESQTLQDAETRTSKDLHPLNELIHDVTKLNLQNANKKNIRLQTEMPDELSASFDYLKLQRALDNLLSNAIKFSPTQTKVTIGCEINEANKIRIYVHDNGPGLTDEDKHKIFQPFKRLSAQPTNGEPSTGLGLSIVKKIAELHGGKAGVISEYRKGARFYMDLPR